ncbi:winged helix-turn-helix domain-containing protein [Parendozoicomonas sp. Alg238-R29]|uniref:helix-turn-helix domain-containing protein n=1 Tax=Parendozoicomonas sp. Alg238-R29 TaxID=2993446 RepID=UPI00248ECCBA|nr:winged helix-turn-helix domain-containing protein [Parendozoicomonas sp. Alg238-R29]
MSKVDGRKISHKVREQTRFRAIEDWLNGMSPPAMADKYGTSRKIVHQWINRYKQDGFDGLKTRTGKPGKSPRLAKEQRDQLSLLLRMKTPQDFGYETTLWTCAIIAAVIHQQFDVKYANNTVSRLLKSMGFSPQKPRWGAWQQDQKKSNGG